MAIFNFSGLEDERVYATGRVVIICGNHQVFNNVMIDRLRDIAAGETFKLEQSENSEVDLEQYNKQLKLKQEIEEEFGFSDSGNKRSGYGTSSLDLDRFFEVCSVPPVSGKWYCFVDYDYMSKKNKERFERYLKKPSQYGILVVLVTDFRDKRKFRTMQAIKSNPNSHLVDLDYPRKSMLESLVMKEFSNYNKRVAEAGVSLFVMKMGNAYDSYSEAIEKIVNQNSDADVINLEMVKEGLKGYDVVSLDDFIFSLCRPMNSKKVVKKRHVYKEAKSLLRDYTAREIITKLKYKVNDMILYRIHINNGNIPILGRYSAQKVKERLPENCTLKKKPDIVFKREAYMASRTSLGDWYYMKLIIETPKGWADMTYLRALYNLMNRQTLSNDRLMNVIGVKDTLGEGLVSLNRILFTEWWQNKARSKGEGEIGGVEEEQQDYTYKQQADGE